MKHLFEFRLTPKGEDQYWSVYESTSSRKTKVGKQILEAFNKMRIKSFKKEAITYDDLENFELREIPRENWLQRS